MNNNKNITISQLINDTDASLKDQEIIKPLSKPK